MVACEIKVTGTIKIFQYIQRISLLQVKRSVIIHLIHSKKTTMSAEKDEGVKFIRKE